MAVHDVSLFRAASWAKSLPICSCKFSSNVRRSYYTPPYLVHLYFDGYVHLTIKYLDELMHELVSTAERASFLLIVGKTDYDFSPRFFLTLLRSQREIRASRFFAALVWRAGFAGRGNGLGLSGAANQRRAQGPKARRPLHLRLLVANV